MLKKISYLFTAVLLSLASCTRDHPIFESDLQGSKPVFEGELEWIRNYGGSGDDSPRAIIATTDGGYAVLGFSNSTDGDLTDKTTAVNDYWLLKLDSEGHLQWNKTYGGSKDDQGQSVIQTTDGGYAITGYAMSSDGDASNNEGFHDNWILKLGPDGAIEWEQSFGFSGHDHSYDLLQTSDGGFFFVGFLDVTAAGGEGNFGKASSLTRHGVGEFWATKINADGTLAWRRYFGGSNNDRAHAAVASDDGGFVMTGFSESADFDISNSKGSYDFWVLKISSKGELLWEQSFGGSGIEISHDIARTKDNAYVITGNTFSEDGDISMNHGESDIWLIKVSDTGSLVWERSYGGSQFDAAQSVSTSGDGGFIISGNSKSLDGDSSKNAGENDMWILKTDSDGKLIWQGSYGGTALDFGFDALETSQKDLILVGETASTDFPGLSPMGNTDAVIIKVNSGTRYRRN